MSALAYVLTVIIVPILVAECTDWLSWCATRLIKAAVRKLPLTAQERYMEEWLAELDQIPGKLSKLAVALQIRSKARATSDVLDGISVSRLRARHIPNWMKTVGLVTLRPFLLIAGVAVLIFEERLWPEDDRPSWL